MRIGIVANAYHPDIGGVETHVKRLCAGLLAAGDEVEVITQHRSRSEETVDGVLVRRFPLTVKAANYRLSMGLWRWLRRNADRYDVLHAHSYHALAALPAALTNRTPLVFTPHYHGTGHSRLRAALHPLYRPLGRRIVARAGRVICVTKAERELLVSHFPEARDRMVVVPNGTDPAPDLVAGPEPGAETDTRRSVTVEVVTSPTSTDCSAVAPRHTVTRAPSRRISASSHGLHALTSAHVGFLWIRRLPRGSQLKCLTALVR